MPTSLPSAVTATGGSETQAQFKTFLQNLRAALAEMGDPLAAYGHIRNLTLSLSVAANALTIAVKDRAGADPTSVDPESVCCVPFRNATVATGDFSVLNVSAASSLVVSSGSTLGTLANVPFRLWIVAFNDAGTWRIGVINCVSAAASAGAGTNVNSIYPLKAWGIASSTAEGGVGAADSAQTFYTGVAVTSKPYVILGYATWEGGLATPGTWSAGPTRVQLFGSGVPLPGETLQIARNETGALATGTTVLPGDDTIPQNTEGDQYLSQAIVPSSAANALFARAQFQGSNSAASGNFTLALFQDAIANALAALVFAWSGGDFAFANTLVHAIVAGTASSTTLKLRAGAGAAGTTTFNGRSSGRLMGGVMASFLEIAEVMT